jgi:hypothetical protein
VFRVEAKNYVRFATNLADAPKAAWGNMLFFRDHNLFLEALRWCQALPRFQASPGVTARDVSRQAQLKAEASLGQE